MGADNFGHNPLDPRHGYGGYPLETNSDLVNHPPHYQTKNGLETIDVIEAFTDGLEGIEAVCTANVIKYICRWKKKNGLQDLLKCRWYLNKLIDIKGCEEEWIDILENNAKFVEFWHYCSRCKYADLPEVKDPCNECLEVEAREGTCVPEKFEKAEVKKNGSKD